jgi:hypothetical protein
LAAGEAGETTLGTGVYWKSNRQQQLKEKLHQQLENESRMRGESSSVPEDGVIKYEKAPLTFCRDPSVGDSWGRGRLFSDSQMLGSAADPFNNRPTAGDVGFDGPGALGKKFQSSENGQIEGSKGKPKSLSEILQAAAVAAANAVTTAAPSPQEAAESAIIMMVREDNRRVVSNACGSLPSLTKRQQLQKQQRDARHNMLQERHKHNKVGVHAISGFEAFMGSPDQIQASSPGFNTPGSSSPSLIPNPQPQQAEKLQSDEQYNLEVSCLPSFPAWYSC